MKQRIVQWEDHYYRLVGFTLKSWTQVDRESLELLADEPERKFS
jgi:hypothetical protein